MILWSPPYLGGNSVPWTIPRMPFNPPKKRAQGFDVVRYRRRCGPAVGYLRAAPATPGLGGVGACYLAASVFGLARGRVVGRLWSVNCVFAYTHA